MFGFGITITLTTVHLRHYLRDGLRADTTIFLNTSAPKILAQTGNKAPLTLEDVTYNAKGPFVVEVVVKSQKLLSVPVPHYEGPVCEITGAR
jgi:hypothetical protein